MTARARLTIAMGGLRTVSESNQREHWSRRARRTRDQKRHAMLCLNSHRAPSPPVLVRLVRIAPRRLDPGNLEASLKHVQDAVATWLGVDDGDTAAVTWRYWQEAGACGEYAIRVEVQ